MRSWHQRPLKRPGQAIRACLRSSSSYLMHSAFTIGCSCEILKYTHLPAYQICRSALRSSTWIERNKSNQSTLVFPCNRLPAGHAQSLTQLVEKRYRVNRIGKRGMDGGLRLEPGELVRSRKSDWKLNSATMTSGLSFFNRPSALRTEATDSTS